MMLFTTLLIAQTTVTGTVTDETIRTTDSWH